MHNFTVLHTVSIFTSCDAVIVDMEAAQLVTFFYFLVAISHRENLSLTQKVIMKLTRKVIQE